MKSARLNITVTPAAIDAFKRRHLSELDERIKRSEAVGAVTLKKCSAAVFYDARDGKFTLIERKADSEEVDVFDCIPRVQWGRMVMLFGHATHSGGYIASGHAVLDGNLLKVRLASRHYYRMEVDATLPCLLPFNFIVPPRPEVEKISKVRRTPFRTQNASNVMKAPKATKHAQSYQAQADHSVGEVEESEDLTVEDLRRLRGEYPLSAKSNKKW